MNSTRDEELLRKELYLTTVDNPFDPKEDYDNWHSYDIARGYNTCERLSRISYTSDTLTDYENNVELLKAMRLLCNSIVVAKDGTMSQYKILVK